ncbi:MAG: cysteine desulfurase NifS [Firmicutes bacterium HGW-Firmicutes-12]|nr:MAG: cysteine desulfurase NifS [Firmicutes bacterium HGW-Firmicutes-12]
MPSVYLDHGATTPVRPEVVEIVNEYMTTIFGNPSSTHTFGRTAKKAMDEARKRIADVIGANAEEIFFTSSGTESDNIAIIGAAYQHKEKGKHIITSSVEHDAVLDAYKFLETEGFNLTILPVDEYGMVSLSDVEEAIKKDTILISVMHANNEVGTIQPVEEIGRIARKNGIIFHIDAVQSFGKLPIDAKMIGADLLSVSGHKIYGPKGTGFLYVRNGIELRPLFFGGEQEQKLRPGTENMSGIVGMGLAAELAVMEMDKEKLRLSKLREKLITGLLEVVPDISINGHPENRVAVNANISFSYVKGKELLHALDLQGIAASSGSACSAALDTPSHVLIAMGLSKELAQGSIRMTLGRENDEEDIDYILSVLPPIVENLRSKPQSYEQKEEKEECPCLH